MWVANKGPHQLIRPLLTSRAVDSRRRLSGASEISPSKTCVLLRTTAASMSTTFGCGSFAVTGPLAPVVVASYAVLVHRPAATIHAPFPHSVTLMQLRFTPFAVTRSRWEFHPQEGAHAGRTKKRGGHRPTPKKFRQYVG